MLDFDAAPVIIKNGEIKLGINSFGNIPKENLMLSEYSTHCPEYGNTTTTSIYIPPAGRDFISFDPDNNQLSFNYPGGSSSDVIEYEIKVSVAESTQNIVVAFYTILVQFSESTCDSATIE